METKTFDAVAMMRELRDRLSNMMADVSPDERIRYIHETVGSTPIGVRLSKMSENSPDTPLPDSLRPPR